MTHAELLECKTMFLFKKIVSPFLFPLPFCLELLMIGVILLWFTRKQTFGKLLVTCGALLLLLLGYSGISGILLSPLESRYPMVDTKALVDLSSGNAEPPVKWIVVLGGGHIADPRVPVTSQLLDASMNRLVEAIRLHRRLPETRLIVSGGPGGVEDTSSDAAVMAEVAEALGVSPQQITLEDKSRDTEEQALNIKAMVSGQPFLLVTSASHMSRSMGLFKKQDLHPIPAPADFRVRDDEVITPSSFFPHSKELHKATVAVYEYMGLAWSRMTGKI